MNARTSSPRAGLRFAITPDDDEHIDDVLTVTRSAPVRGTRLPLRLPSVAPDHGGVTEWALPQGAARAVLDAEHLASLAVLDYADALARGGDVAGLRDEAAAQVAQLLGVLRAGGAS